MYYLNEQYANECLQFLMSSALIQLCAYRGNLEELLETNRQTQFGFLLQFSALDYSSVPLKSQQTQQPPTIRLYLACFDIPSTAPSNFLANDYSQRLLPILFATEDFLGNCFRQSKASIKQNLCQRELSGHP